MSVIFSADLMPLLALRTPHLPQIGSRITGLTVAVVVAVAVDEDVITLAHNSRTTAPRRRGVSVLLRTGLLLQTNRVPKPLRWVLASFSTERPVGTGTAVTTRTIPLVRKERQSLYLQSVARSRRHQLGRIPAGQGPGGDRQRLAPTVHSHAVPLNLDQAVDLLPMSLLRTLVRGRALSSTAAISGTITSATMPVASSGT